MVQDYSKPQSKNYQNYQNYQEMEPYWDMPYLVDDNDEDFNVYELINYLQFIIYVILFFNN